MQTPSASVDPEPSFSPPSGRTGSLARDLAPLDDGYPWKYKTGKVRVNARGYPTTLQGYKANSTWQLDYKYTSLVTRLGVSDETVSGDSVVFTIMVDMPRMNSTVERWIQTCRRELLDRTLIWDQRHLLHALREFESFYNEHRPYRTLGQAAPLRPLPEPITEPGQIAHLKVHRRDRLGGILHEYQHAA
ncbi:integrase-like protein [Streptomyces brevispora]|uniref:Integrase-like protein n=1 Tax=Streptomyces brevispora TaxID=887462 RepID=A0A561TYQ8_9ACTN|nr:integrase-like protein [Streptomyces brevispora]